eukprot:CAMPEP_0178982146 /NCGR_PEP_ID=MMETSP0795-20121207/337_1 /TAXON_ID=88552 /ORGANISM="Amoebophrya sp., Strain Ameob2" /LENGTH=415 /DNA_ID=CAMNT_0020672765 /DNA_START=39 /DNA_END=1286 /DNA_ORIENTATION=+
MVRFILAIAVSGQTVEVAGAKWNKKAGSEVDKPQSKGFLGITDEPEGDALTLTPDGDVLGGQGGLNATAAAFLEAADGDATNVISCEASEPVGASVPQANAKPGKTDAAYTKECITMTEKLCAEEKEAGKKEAGALVKAKGKQDAAWKYFGWFEKVNPFLEPLDAFYNEHWTMGEGDNDGLEGDAAKCASVFLGEQGTKAVGDLLENIHEEMEAGEKRRRLWAVSGRIQEYRTKRRLVSEAKKLLEPICEQLKAAPSCPKEIARDLATKFEDVTLGRATNARPDDDGLTQCMNTARDWMLAKAEENTPAGAAMTRNLHTVLVNKMEDCVKRKLEFRHSPISGPLEARVPDTCLAKFGVFAKCNFSSEDSDGLPILDPSAAPRCVMQLKQAIGSLKNMEQAETAEPATEPEASAAA